MRAQWHAYMATLFARWAYEEELEEEQEELWQREEQEQSQEPVGAADEVEQWQPQPSQLAPPHEYHVAGMCPRCSMCFTSILWIPNARFGADLYFYIHKSTRCCRADIFPPEVGPEF